MEAPDEFSGSQPVFDGDHVWGIARDEHVVWYWIVVGAVLAGGLGGCEEKAVVLAVMPMDLPPSA